jgi:hypothetical protein
MMRLSIVPIRCVARQIEPGLFLIAAASVAVSQDSNQIDARRATNSASAYESRFYRKVRVSRVIGPVPFCATRLSGALAVPELLPAGKVD